MKFGWLDDRIGEHYCVDFVKMYQIYVTQGDFSVARHNWTKFLSFLDGFLPITFCDSSVLCSCVPVPHGG